jgi:hypothetical protein
LSSSVVRKIPERFRVFLERFRKGSIKDRTELSEFISTRSAYVAQTSLYGYLKTRMGTRFRSMFEDEVFSRSIKDSVEKLFISCAADLTIYSVSILASQNRESVDHLDGKATELYREALVHGLKDHKTQDDLEVHAEAFSIRAQSVTWETAFQDPKIFSKSIGDLIRFAPVVEEFKDLDREIVTNSIRFRWRDIRDQAQRRLKIEKFNW